MADTQEQDLMCPACGKTMKKIFMAEAGINIDICLDGCGGIYFDNRELNRFDESHEKIDEILEAIKGREFKKVDKTQIRECPVCHIPMVKMGSGAGGVEIDVCNTCGGKFLDNNELQIIRGSADDTGMNEWLDALCEEMYKDDLRDAIGKNAEKQIKSSSRRQFFENLLRNYYLK